MIVSKSKVKECFRVFRIRLGKLIEREFMAKGKEEELWKDSKKKIKFRGILKLINRKRINAFSSLLLALRKSKNDMILKNFFIYS